MKPTLCVILLFAGAIASGAQTIKPPETWNRLAEKADEAVSVTMDRNMLQFASKFMDEEGDAEGKQIISKLNGIYVRSFEFKATGAYSESDVAPVRAQLQGPQWTQMVHVDSKENKEKVDIYLKIVNGQTMGMVILAQEPQQLTLVDLDGPINPEDIGQLSGNFGIPSDLKTQKKPTPPAHKPATAVKK